MQGTCTETLLLYVNKNLTIISALYYVQYFSMYEYA